MYQNGYVHVLNKKQCQNLSENDWYIRAAIQHVNQTNICTRCNQVIAETCILPNGVCYCPFCLQFGRLTSQDFLCSKKPSECVRREVFLSWQGELTIYQKRVANALCQNYFLHQHTLVWAVTGAGKTEMLFPLIYQALSDGKRVCIASPRIDVCLELFPRIKQAFTAEDIYLLYGNSEESYRETSLFICTTHQLVHFYRSIDVLIIDEIDAFPYADDVFLNFASKQALKKDGLQVFLTATPSNQLIKNLNREKKFQICKLPLRFHQRPLLQPKCIWFNQWEKIPYHPRKGRKFVRLLQELCQNQIVLVFCPSIQYNHQLYVYVHNQLPNISMTEVSSIDEKRQEKVRKLRNQHFKIIFTTTILERGVTIDNVSIVIVGANHPVFSKSALVQIAGRADRKGTVQNGMVYFLLSDYTLEIKQACREITAMNQLAKKWLNDEMHLV